MKKLKIKGLKKEMSTTGTGASFAPGIGGQYATPKAFKKKKTEAWSKLRQGQLGIAQPAPIQTQLDVSHPLTIPNPSIPNRKSKAIDYVQLWGEAKEHYQKHLKYNPIKDMTASQAGAGDNTGIDMDSLDAANVLELAKFAKPQDKIKIGDTDVKDGVKYTVNDIDPISGAIQWKVDYIPNFGKVFSEFKELRNILNQLAKKTDDIAIDDINDDVRSIFNKYRTHVRKEYPDAYKRIFVYEGSSDMREKKNTNEERWNANVELLFQKITQAIQDISYQGEITMDQAAYNAVGHIEDEFSIDLGLDENVIKGSNNPEQIRLVTKFIKRLADRYNYSTQDAVHAIQSVIKSKKYLRESRYSAFKKETKLRTPTEQIHRAVREINKKMNEIIKLVGHTERMKSELKQSNEGMSYLKRTRNAINNISEKLTQLNNRIKGLTE